MIINKLKHQITENEENLFFLKKYPDVSSDLKLILQAKSFTKIQILLL